MGKGRHTQISQTRHLYTGTKTVTSSTIHTGTDPMLHCLGRVSSSLAGTIVGEHIDDCKVVDLWLGAWDEEHTHKF